MRVEACGFVGMANVVERGLQRRERAGKGGSAAAWVECCGRIGCGAGFGVCVAGWWCGACAGGGSGALVGDWVCGAGAPACGGRWIVACGVCSMYAAPLRLPVLPGDFSGPGLSFWGRGSGEAGCAVAAVRTRGWGWGSAGRAVWADGWRMRGADTRTGSGTALVGASAAARHELVRVRGLRLAPGRCEIGLVWVEGMRVRWNGGCGRARMAAAGKGGSAAAWAERCGWIGCGFGFFDLGLWLVGGVMRVLAAGRGF
jgi:hypothetical protein